MCVWRVVTHVWPRNYQRRAKTGRERERDDIRMTLSRTIPPFAVIINTWLSLRTVSTRDKWKFFKTIFFAFSSVRRFDFTSNIGTCGDICSSSVFSFAHLCASLKEITCVSASPHHFEIRVNGPNFFDRLGSSIAQLPMFSDCSLLAQTNIFLEISEIGPGHRASDFFLEASQRMKHSW